MQDNWRTVRFDQIADNIAERVEPSDADTDIYVGLEHLDPDSLRLKRWGTPADVEGTKLRFYPGDVIFGRRRAYQRKLAVAEFEGICSAHAMVLRARLDVCLPEFLPFFLQSDRFFECAMAISVGSLSPTINWKTLAVQEFPLPPLDEQRRSAEILWAAEETKAKYAELLGATHIYRQVLLDRIIPDPENQEGSEHVVVLADVCWMQNGRGFPSEDYRDVGIKLLRPGNLGKDGYFCWNDDATRCLPNSYQESASAYLVNPGDLVINLTAQSLEDGFMGRVCLAREGDFSLLNQRIGRFYCGDGLLSEYLYRCLQTSRFRKTVETNCEGSKVKHLYWRHISDFLLVMPSIVEQEKVLKVLKAAQETTDKTEHSVVSASHISISLRERLLH